MRKKYSIIIGICMVLALFISCNDLDLAPTNKFTDPTYWTSTEKASAVLNKAYQQMFGANYFFANEKLSDNLYEGRGSSDEKTITSGQADAALGRFANEWKDSYEGIKTCHIFLENVDRVPAMDETLKERMKAEARFIRAFLFNRLASHYGDIPLFDRSLTLQEANNVERTPKSEVLKFVRDELNAIVSILPTKQEYKEKDQGRITQGAVMTLLARTYLYENDWTNVASICEKIINGEFGKYELFPSYEGLFLPENEYNNEVILDLGYTLELRTWSEYYDAIPLTEGGRINGFAPTQELVDDYVMKNGKTINEEGSGYNENAPYANRDPRFDATIVYHGYKWRKENGSVSTIYIRPGSAEEAGETDKRDEYAGPGQNATPTGYYLRKYYDPTAPEGMAAGLNLILMRYADVLLMYAEAKNELGQMNETIWNQTIRPIRERAGFTDASALNFPASKLQEIIRRERRSELAIEGLRLFDIRRWKLIETVLNIRPRGDRFGANNTHILLDQRKFNKDRDYLFAIPQSQRDIDKNLTQNPGY
ncbi:RagB/SusD family nutrient uptake outer membrane protein [Limibacterium fermenti]|uniref:RagB/SusD family nutrient uptake outer membrane protein n=1 Tax=Limibacterium fermenti TaxID=3229863 RepID=UPI000E8DB4FE|nr:RagB/SusD family nutrient uptake outer membrane protein [Porphyromonadaceae bacterium]